MPPQAKHSSAPETPSAAPIADLTASLVWLPVHSLQRQAPFPFCPLSNPNDIVSVHTLSFLPSSLLFQQLLLL